MGTKDVSDIGDHDPFNYSISKHRTLQKACAQSQFYVGVGRQLRSYPIQSTRQHTLYFTLVPASKVMGLQYSQARCSLVYFFSHENRFWAIALLVNKLGPVGSQGLHRRPDTNKIPGALSLHMLNQQFSLRLTLFHVFDVSQRIVPETLTNMYQRSRLKNFYYLVSYQYTCTPCGNIGVIQGCQGPHIENFSQLINIIQQ